MTALNELMENEGCRRPGTHWENWEHVLGCMSNEALSRLGREITHSWPVKNITFRGVHQKRHIVLSIGPTEGSHEGGHNFLYLATI